MQFNILIVSLFLFPIFPYLNFCPGLLIRIENDHNDRLQLILNNDFNLSKFDHCSDFQKNDCGRQNDFLALPLLNEIVETENPVFLGSLFGIYIPPTNICVRGFDFTTSFAKSSPHTPL